MKKKLILFLVAAVATCGTAGVLSACSSGPESQVYNPGDTIVEEREGEFTYDQNGQLVESKYTGKNITVKYLVSETAYVTLTGEKASEMVIDGYAGDVTELSVKEIEDKVAIDNVRVSVVGVANGAFYGCETLTKVDLTKTNSSLSFKVGDYAFANCASLTGVTMPEDNVYTVSATIGYSAFLNNTALTTLNLGSKLTEIGGYAFQNCLALTSVTIPQNVSVVEEYTFADCDALNTLSVASGAKLKSIKSNAFANTSISSLDLNSLSDLRYIGSSAFANTKLSTVNLPESVSNIGYHAFYNCKSLSTINVPFLGSSIVNSYVYNSNQHSTIANVMSFKDIYGMDGTKDTRNFSITIKSAAQIADYSFANMENLNSLTVNSFAETGAYKVYHSDGVSFTRVNLTSIEPDEGDELPTNTALASKVIGNYAFDGCKNLSTVKLPTDTEEIGKYAFNKCTSLSEFTLPNKLETVEDNAFYGCSQLKSISIPASVTYVGELAFGGCNNLETITVAQLNGLITAEKYNGEYMSLYPVSSWLSSQNYVKTVTVNSLCTLPNSMFEGMSNLETVSLTFKEIDVSKANTTSFTAPTAELGNYAFSNCSSLKNLTITDADGIIEEIGYSTFGNCKSLPSYTIPATVKTIGGSAFKGCILFTELTVPASVYSLGSNALENCIALTSLTIESYNTVLEEEASIPGMGSSSDSSDLYKTIVSGSLGNLFGGSANVPEKLTTLTLKNVNQLASNALNGWENLVTLNIEFTPTLYVGSGRDATPNYTTIGGSAFSGCKKLANFNVTGGDNVKAINSYAFANCKLLTSATLAAFANVAEIGSYAFSGCEGLTTATISGLVTKLGNYVFYNCPNITVLNLGNYAVLSESYIANLFGSDGSYVDELDDNDVVIKSVQKYVNGLPLTLETVTVNGAKELSDLNGLFYNLTTVKVIALNLSTTDTSLLIEGYSIFSDCTSLEKVFLPETITKIYYANGISVWDNGSYELGDATVYTYTTTPTSYGNYWHYEESKEEVEEGEEPELLIVESKADDYKTKTYTLNLDGGVLPEGFVYDQENTGSSEGETDAPAEAALAEEGEGEEETPAEPEAPAGPESVNLTVEGGVLTADKLPALTKEGYTFVGWYSNSSCTGKPVNFPYYNAGNTNLYAKWVEGDSLVETKNTNFSTYGSGYRFSFAESDATQASYTIKVWKASTVTLNLSVNGYKTGNSSIVVRVNGITKFTINNSSYGDERLGLTTYYNTLSTKTLTIDLEVGDEITVRATNNNYLSSENYAFFSYTVADYQEVSVQKPEIPATTIPTYNAGDVVGEKGVDLTDEEVFENAEEVFTNAINKFLNLNGQHNFAASMTINGVTITETYDIWNSRIKQEVKDGDNTQAVYYEYDYSYTIYDSYEGGYVLGASKMYFTFTAEQVALMEEAAKQQFGDKEATAILATLRDNWFYTTMGHENVVTGLVYNLHFSNPAISTNIEDYDYDKENGAYTKVLATTNDGYESVLALTFDNEGNANYYLSLYKYNELYYTVKVSGLNKSSLTLPNEVKNAVNIMDWMQNMQNKYPGDVEEPEESEEPGVNEDNSVNSNY